MDPDDVLPARWAQYYLGNAPSLGWLLVVNGLAFLVGVRYYVESMPAVSTFLWPMYGDSPMAIALATLSLATLLPHLGRPVDLAPVNRPLAYLHTLAFAWLVKYGLWTVIALNLRADLYIGFDLAAVTTYWGIVVTHAAFLLEAFLIPHYGATTRGALGLALGLLLLNDLLDYGFGLHPPIRYEPGAVLVVLTVLCTFVAVGAAAAVFRTVHEA